ncbi:MAG: peptidylprolyl isomerase, partial [Clostridia bacterium]|nr:peptidylprolyl isomerase [Clostridia bacterium]
MKTAKKILAAIFLMGTLVLSLMALTSCTGNEEPTDPAYYQIDKFEIDKDNKLIVITGGGRRISAGNLPSNPSNLKLVDAYVDDGYIWVNVSGYLHRCSLPELNKDNRINSVRINSDGHLVFKTTSGDFDAGLIFLPTMPNSPLTPSGASEYASRDTSENDTATVKIKVQGYGEITILVDKTVSPTAAEKFISLAKAGKYDGITFSMMLADKLFYSEAADSELAPPSAFEVLENPIENKKGTVGLILDDEGNITSKLYFATADLSSEYDGLLLPFGYVINGMNIVTEINELTAPYSNPLFNYEIDDEQRRAAIESITVVD